MKSIGKCIQCLGLLFWRPRGHDPGNVGIYILLETSESQLSIEQGGHNRVFLSMVAASLISAQSWEPIRAIPFKRV